MKNYFICKVFFSKFCNPSELFHLKLTSTFIISAYNRTILFNINITFSFSDFVIVQNVSACYVVPKPLKPELACYVPHHNSEQVWRIHLPEAEMFILNEKKNLKCVIQLAKVSFIAIEFFIAIIHFMR